MPVLLHQPAAPPEPGDGVNTIAWVDDWSARGLPADAPGYTDVAYRGNDAGWEIAEADILLNAEGFDWSKLSVASVLTHELGHALGLEHPCEDGGADGAPRCEDADQVTLSSAMYPFYDPTHLELGEDDVAGICYLYPAGACNGGCGPRATCVDDVCRATCGDAVCAVGESCGFWGCVPEGACVERDCRDHGCKNVADCGPLLDCVSGTCREGDKPWGSGCEKNAQCKEGACVGGTCEPLCADDKCASDSGKCELADEGRGTGCVDSRSYPFGNHCSSGEDCESGICLTTEDEEVCTRECESSDSCPSGWSCGKAEGRRVCLPPVEDDGCTVAGGALRTSDSRLGETRRISVAVVLAALVGAAAFRRRGRRQ